MSKGKRNPSTHRTDGQTLMHRKTYQQRPEVKARKRAADNARYALEKKGAISKGQDAGHVKPMSKGGAKGMSNVKAVDRSKNRGHGMGRNGTKPDAKTLQMRRRLKG